MDTQLIEPTSQNKIMSPKLLSQQIRKGYHKTLGTNVLNSPMSTLFAKMKVIFCESKSTPQKYYKFCQFERHNKNSDTLNSTEVIGCLSVSL